MLHEIHSKFLSKSQREKGVRWFSGRSHDLFVWQNIQGRLAAFQFSFLKGTRNEHIVTWDSEKSQLNLRRVRESEGTKPFKQSPTLESTELLLTRKCLNEFRQAGNSLDKRLKTQIEAIIEAYLTSS